MHGDCGSRESMVDFRFGFVTMEGENTPNLRGVAVDWRPPVAYWIRKFVLARTDSRWDRA